MSEQGATYKEATSTPFDTFNTQFSLPVRHHHELAHKEGPVSLFNSTHYQPL